MYFINAINDYAKRIIDAIFKVTGIFPERFNDTG